MMSDESAVQDDGSEPEAQQQVMVLCDEDGGCDVVIGYKGEERQVLYSFVGVPCPGLTAREAAKAVALAVAARIAGCELWVAED